MVIGMLMLSVVCSVRGYLWLCDGVKVKRFIFLFLFFGKFWLLMGCGDLLCGELFCEGLLFEVGVCVGECFFCLYV